MKRASRLTRAVAGLIALTAAALPALAQPGGPKGEKPEFPKFEDVAKGYEKVVSTTDGPGLYTLWVRDKDAQILAELPRGYQNQRHFFAMTVGSGEVYAGLQGASMYTYWRRYDKRLALIEPNLSTRSTGDEQSKDSVKALFTDRVVLDVPIVCMGPSGQPVIDLDALLLGQAGKFFGGSAAGLNPHLAKIKEAKAFPQNIEVAFEAPVGAGGFKTFHYSISVIPKNDGYKPRMADQRVGYFVTSYRDLGKFKEDEKWVRYINRWDLEKRDPSLKLSPPKKPIIFYIEHTVPVRYRRFIRDGILYWNKAFEKVGIVDAIEVRYQDKATGANMEKDPEDVRYNFIRWLSNDIGTAIGPSRVNPETGEILDADVVLTDGWIRYYWFQYNDLLPDIAMQSFGPETYSWLNAHPQWDPRIRLVDPDRRAYLLAQRAAKGVQPYGGHPMAMADPTLDGDDEYDGLAGRTSQNCGMCMAARGKGMDMAMLRMYMAIMPNLKPPGDDKKASDDEPKTDDGNDPGKPEGDVIDGIPDWFIGPMLADLVAHEVGHTLGLRHNFKASSYYSMAQINSPEGKNRPFTTSVMDYNPININMGAGAEQGPYTMTDIGVYDRWAIDYGYTFGDPKKVANESAQPQYAYATDEDTIGPDPLARRYDFSANPLDYANNQMRLVKYYRDNLLNKFVKDGDSWAKARRGYNITLSLQMSCLSMMANWVGGDFVSRVKKGEPGGGPPIQVVSADKQRAALDFCIDNCFNDAAFGLTPEMLKYLTVDKWFDGGGMSSVFEDASWPVHDRIMGIQASTLTMLMNPTTLKRVYDNEFQVPEDEDMITLPELMDKITNAIWSEIDTKPSKAFTNRKPMISSLRRNLQREHLERLIDLTMPGAMTGAAAKPIASLATYHLRTLHDKINTLLENSSSKLDAYTLAHLSEARTRIAKALDAEVIYNADQIGTGGSGMPFFFKSPDKPGH